jgi:hypothetical protein
MPVFIRITQAILPMILRMFHLTNVRIPPLAREDHMRCLVVIHNFSSLFISGTYAAFAQHSST